MPRLSPQELQEAKRQREKEREDQARRDAEAERKQAEDRARAELIRDEKKRRLAVDKKRYDQVRTQASALHQEVGKFAIKYPQYTVTTRMVDKTNNVVRATKELVKDEDDDFAGDIGELIPAGDNPEYRDVLLTLTEVLATLDRFKNKYRKQWSDQLGEFV